MVMPPVEIRDMEPAELSAVAILWRDVYRHTYPDVEVSADPEYWEGGLKSKLEESCRLVVAEMEDRLVGMMVLNGPYLDQLYIHPRYHGKRVGTRMLKMALSEYPDYLHLHTLAQNEKAIGFFEYHGFRVTAQGIAPDEQVPNVHMEFGAAT